MKTLWESATIFLHQNGYKIPEDKLKVKMLAHPDYPSLYSLSDILNKMFISHRVFKLDEENLSLLEFPVMAHVEYKGKQGFETITSKRALSKSKSIIFQNHQGYFLMLETKISIAKITIPRNVKNLYFAGLVLMLTLGLFYDLGNLSNISSHLIFLINLSGLSISFFLLSSELGGEAFTRMCFIKGGRCVDKDRQASRHISFADLAAIFFTTNTLFFIVYKFAGHLDDALLIYSYISYLTIPVIIASVVVQFFQKRWCILCIAIDVLLVLNVILSIKNSFHATISSGIGLVFVLYLFLFILCSSWLILKDIIKKQSLSDQKQVEVTKFLTRKDIFEAALHQSNYLAVEFWEDEISLGERDSKYRFLLVLKPNCAEGNVFLEMFKNLAKIFTGELFVAIRFNGDHADIQSAQTALREKFVEINQSEPYNICDLTLRHMEWCQEKQISKVPVIYLNGYKIPEIYGSDYLSGICYDLLSEDLIIN